MDFSNLSGVDKAALLLLCLGEETTAQVFKELNDTEIKMICRSMMNIDHVPKDIAQKILDHYKQTKNEYAGIFVDGTKFMQDAISATGDPGKVEAFREEMSAETNPRSLGTISTMDPRTVASLLVNEHPQTIALILSTQKSDHAGKILPLLPEELKSDVIYRIAKIDKVSPEVISQIEKAMQREIGGVVSREQQQVGGVDKVVDILTQMEKGIDLNLIDQIEEYDPETAEKIRGKMFTFEDLVNVDDRGMQVLLREVRNETLTIALKTASQQVKDKIFSNVSERAREMIKEDLEAMGPVKLSDVESAQQSIVHLALRLEEEGKIVIPGRGGQEILV